MQCGLYCRHLPFQVLSLYQNFMKVCQILQCELALQYIQLCAATEKVYMYM